MELSWDSWMQFVLQHATSSCHILIISFCLNTDHPFTLPIGVPIKNPCIYVSNTPSHNSTINNNGVVVWRCVQECLVKLHLAESNRCASCGRPDTLLHRITECGEGTHMWRWTRIDSHSPNRTQTYTTRVDYKPTVQILAPAETRCIIMNSCTPGVSPGVCRRISQIDYADYMRRARSKA